MMDYIYVYTRQADGDVSYTKCVVTQIRHPVLHHFAMVSANQPNENRVSDIDIDAVYVKNYDKKVYDNDAELEKEGVELSAEIKNIKKQQDGTYHPADIMAHKLQIHIEEQNRKSLTFFVEQDSKKDLLFKHFSSLSSYKSAF